MTTGGSIPVPSDAVLIRLAGIAAHAEDLLAADQQVQKAPVGLRTIKNDRRRTMEAILVLLADPEVHNYIATLEKQGLLPAQR
ncbi:MAG TPA: hypothetical protein VIN12_00215 [Candidatus Dormibacteraeota bacterium]|jgi:hypothetical protein